MAVVGARLGRIATSQCGDKVLQFKSHFAKEREKKMRIEGASTKCRGSRGTEIDAVTLPLIQIVPSNGAVIKCCVKESESKEIKWKQ